MPRQKRKHESLLSEAEAEKDECLAEFTEERLENETIELDHNYVKPSNLYVDSLSCEENPDSPKMSKRPRISLDDSVESPCSSFDISDNRDTSPSSIQSNDSDHSHVADINDSFTILSNIPEVIDLSTPSLQGRSDVVDLTTEPSTPTHSNDVVDLTRDHGDASPVIIRVNKIFERPSGSASSESIEIEQINDGLSLNPSNIERSSNKQDVNTNSSVINCPICFDDINVLKRRKRQLSSTVCGHVFCDKCIKSAIKSQNKCPTCRKKLRLNQIHPLFL